MAGDNLPLFFVTLLVAAVLLKRGAEGVAGALGTSSTTAASGTSAGSTTSAGSAGGGDNVSLAGIPGTSGPVAGSFIPDTAWNPLHDPIADWIVPILQWASEHGWTGTVTSGYRSYAQQLAIHDSGAYSAVPGTSNHETTEYPGGAVDVTDPAQLIAVLKSYVGPRKLIGGVLGAVDPEHFSATGH